MKPRELAALGAFLALALGIGALGSAATAQSVGTWYQGLAKPPFNPPDWVFAPLWTTLYALIAVAGAATVAYALQLTLKLGWPVLFFGQRMIGAALIEITVLLAAIATNAVLFWRIDRPAGLLLVPYAGWVGVSCLLNFELWRLSERAQAAPLPLGKCGNVAGLYGYWRVRAGQ